jgi:hypothetical protein
MIKEIENDQIINSLKLPDYLKKAIKHNKYRRINMNYDGRTRSVIKLKRYS